MPRSAALSSVCVALAFAGIACRDDQSPAAARALWDEIHAEGGFRTWRHAPGYLTRQPSFTAHSNAVDIFVNTPVAQTLESSERADEWPVGSIVVKEGFRGLDPSDARAIVAVMKKQPDGWFWAEYDGEGETLFSGRPKICLDCHDDRASYSDWVYSFELPR